MRLIETPPGEIVDGEIWFDGRDLLALTIDEMREVRGDDIAMIFQEPMTSLNPVFTVGDQIGEAVRLHQKVSDREARNRAIESLRLVGLSAPERRAKQYPHEMSRRHAPARHDRDGPRRATRSSSSPTSRRPRST